MAIAQPNTESQHLGLTQVHIKCPSDDGLDALISGHTAQRHEEKREVMGKHTSKTIDVLKQFCEIMSDKVLWWNIGYTPNNSLTTVLSPNEIRAAFQAMLSEVENNPKCETYDNVTEKTGVLVSMLIQLSYNAGCNDFVLDTENFQRDVCNIGYNLKGNKEKLIKIKINGDAANLCKFGSYCEIDVDGRVHSYSNGAVQEYSHHCMFIVRGEVPMNVGMFYARKSIYKTPNKGTLSSLLINVIQNSCNQIVFINPDGTEDVVIQHNFNGTIIDIDEKYFDWVLHISHANSSSSGVHNALLKLKEIRKGKLYLKPIE